MKTALILGGNGFIGHHLARRLKNNGYWVRVVDIEAYKYGNIDYADEMVIGDLTNIDVMRRVVVDKYQEPFYESKPFDEVYQLAALMGGAGFIFTGDNDADIMTNSALINLNLCKCLYGTEKVFYSSSACMYPQEIQNIENTSGIALKEGDAYPANPDSEYGWEKLFGERLFLSYARNKGIRVRIGRFHNIFGPEGTYKGGKEKAPAAICRKVAELNHRNNTIEVWGDGEQTRSFLYIDECVEAVLRLMQSDCQEPVNIGSDEMVTINQLVKMVLDVSGKHDACFIHHIPGPQGVRGRNSDNTMIREKLGWAPSMPLEDGIRLLYSWVNSMVIAYSLNKLK
jgi:GDP-D-mannose 3',5'-epimerase